MESKFIGEMIEGDIKEEDILFISDIEIFSPEIKKNLIKEANGKKLIVFIGDILSGLSDINPYYKLFQESSTVFKTFYEKKKLMKKFPKIDEYELSLIFVGKTISEKLSEEYKEKVTPFKSFVKYCNKIKVPIIFFTGNHDSLFHSPYNLTYIPFLKEIYKLKGLYFPKDYEKIRLNDDLYLMGMNTPEDNPEEEYSFPQIKEILKEIQDNRFNNAEQIIFVSHLPGKEKFSKLGSEDITNLKRRYKFKYHYHGHVKDYHGEYIEKGIPTRSVHINVEEK